MEELITLLLLFIFFWFIWSGIRCKEIATAAGLAHCQQHAVQFLDQTVERRKLYLTKDSRNNPCWYRSFHFEFATNGQYRYQGRIEMYGYHLKSIEMEPYPDSNDLPDNYNSLH